MLILRFWELFFTMIKLLVKRKWKKIKKIPRTVLEAISQTNHLIKFLQSRIKTWRVRVRTGYQFFQEKSLVRVSVLPIKEGIVDKYYFSHLTYFFGATKNPTLLFLTGDMKMDRIPAKFRWKMHALVTLYFKFWRYFF